MVDEREAEPHEEVRAVLHDRQQIDPPILRVCRQAHAGAGSVRATALLVAAPVEATVGLGAGVMRATMTSTTSVPSTTIQRGAERAGFDFGWLNTHHSFSFGQYHDPENVHWGALRVLNDDVVAPGKGFGAHPHRDMEILTYVLSGELEHKDSMGNVGVVKPGGVQYLSAGTGIVHSEYNHSQSEPVHFVQMWVVPKAAGLAPRYGQVDLGVEQRLNRWLPIASGDPDAGAPIAIWQDATAFVARVENATLRKTIDADRRAFLFVASGVVTFGSETLHAGDAVRIAGPIAFDVAGAGELVLWDVPPLFA